MDLLPEEILLHIFSYVECKTLISTVKILCKRFYELLSVENNWKFLFPEIGSNHEYYDIDDYGRDKVIYYKCTDRKFWRGIDQPISIDYLRGSIGAVDVVRIFDHGQYCLSGSRDKSVNIWSLDQQLRGDPSKYHIGSLDGHNGWVWTLEECNNTVYSGSWDHNVMIWDLNANGKLLDTIRDVHPAAVLRLQVKDNVLYTGCHDSAVRMFDLRVDYRNTSHELYRHRRAALCMTFCDDYLITGSEDKTVIVYDTRANAILKTLKTASSVTALNCGYDQLRVGIRNDVQIYSTKDGLFTEMDIIPEVHSKGIMGIHHDLSCMITCSIDGTIKVSEASKSPKVIKVLDHHKSAVARIDYRDGILASASSDATGTIGIIRRYGP
ncbi:F-box/WD repeat-containing protein 9 [Trichoplax sp. H2]|nr:F-box/WD repeat-containing protein 9 [Trichoplax sp. H2]|eukprot:RDD43662.1 F-box/WD repeat-containing protein 9 [Trichoplax sp. H2]